MLADVKFSKYGEGTCQSCGEYSSDICIAAITSGKKIKCHAVCKKCASKINEMVRQKNEEIKNRADGATDSICVVCGNLIRPGESCCSFCGTPSENVNLPFIPAFQGDFTKLKNGTADADYNQNAGSYPQQQVYQQYDASQQYYGQPDYQQYYQQQTYQQYDASQQYYAQPDYQQQSYQQYDASQQYYGQPGYSDQYNQQSAPVQQTAPAQQAVQQSAPVQSAVQQTVPAQQVILQAVPIQQAVQQTAPVQQVVLQAVPTQQAVQQTVPVQQAVQQTVPVQQAVQQAVPVQPVILTPVSVQTVQQDDTSGQEDTAEEDDTSEQADSTEQDDASAQGDTPEQENASGKNDAKEQSEDPAQNPFVQSVTEIFSEINPEAAQAVEGTSGKSDKFSKMGGTLLTFCVTQVITFVYQFITEFRDSANPTMFKVILCVVVGIFAALVIWAITKKDGMFLRLYSIGAAAFLIMDFGYLIISILNKAANVTEVLTNFTVSLIYVIGWFGYFIKSKRCGVYFGGKDYLEKSVVTKRIYRKRYKDNESGGNNVVVAVPARTNIVLAPVNAAPVNAVQVNTVPVNTVPVNTVPVNSAPVNPANGNQA